MRPHALLDMAEAGTETAAYAMRGLKPALVLLQSDGGDGELLPDLMAVIADNQPDIAQAAVSYEHVLSAREAVGDTAALPWRVQTLLTKADPLLPLGGDGLALLQMTPELAGMDGTRRYLIIAQNEDEFT